MAFTSSTFPFGNIIDIDLSVEHINKEIEVHAVVLAVLFCDGAATIRLDKSTSVALNLLRIGTMNFGEKPIKRLYLSNAAQAGKTAQILVTELKDITIQAAPIAGSAVLVTAAAVKYDAREAEQDTTEIEDIEIRDTAAHQSTSIIASAHRSFTFVFISTLDDAVSIQLQGSHGGGVWVDIGTPTIVAAGAIEYQTVTEAWAHFWCISTCAIAPTSGSLLIEAIRRS